MQTDEDEILHSSSIVPKASGSPREAEKLEMMKTRLRKKGRTRDVRRLCALLSKLFGGCVSVHCIPGLCITFKVWV